jgi:uncharacterized repeat protein (TIGR01451 family)
MRAPLKPTPTRQKNHTVPRKHAGHPTKRLLIRAWLSLLLIISAAVACGLAAMPGSAAAPAPGGFSNLSQARAGALSIPPALLRAKAPGLEFTPFAALLQAAPAEAVLTFAADDCATSKTDWSLGESVCVKVTGVFAGSPRTLVLVNPNGYVVDSVSVSPTATSYTFDLPGDATGTYNGEPIDNRGSWVVATTDPQAAVRALAVIVVHNAPVNGVTEPVADLQISKTPIGSNQAVAGQNISFLISVFNQGPDSATNLDITDAAPANTTLVSLTQDSGPAFTCASTGGTSHCTRATLARYEQATFTVVYTVNGSIPDGTDLTDTAEVTSDTDERRDTDNTATTTTNTSNPSAPNCTIACPANVTQDSDPGQAGAVVNYAAPTTGGTCGAVTTDHPSGSFFPIGTTVVTASTSDGASCSFSVTVIDKRAVSIHVNGSPNITVECRTGFTDPGATAVDANNQPLTVTATVTIPSGQEDINGDPINPVTVPAVDPNQPNTYTITYTASDNDGHTGKATRTVTVVDTAAPVITLAGVSGFTPQTETVTVTNDDGTTSTITETILVGTVECSDSLTPPTATAFDGCDNHSVPVTTSGGADTGTPGTYEIIYKASDASGNDAEQRVRVTVVDTTGPVISLNGASPMTVECHTSYTEPGASAADACEGPVPVSISGSVNANVVGPYTITYTASDSGGRTTTVTRTVNVVDTTPPVVTLNGAASATVECHTSYTDAGASATDSCDPTTALSSTSDVNVNAPGTYHVVWSATDDSGNVGTATRTVVVVDTIPPTLTLNSYAPSLWPANHKYQTFTVTNFVVDANDSCNTALGISNVVIEKVTSDEAENGNGDGNTLNDIVIASDCKSVQLRAEREGNGNGRVYTITFKVSDGYNVTRKTAKVVVPHNPGQTPVDGGANYTVNGSCP